MESKIQLQKDFGFLVKKLAFLSKGQLISKCLFGIFNSPKKQTEKFDFSTMVPQVDCFRPFFGRIEDTKKTFRN